MAIPKYQHIKDDLKQQIISGKFENGDKFYTEAELIKIYNVSSITVVRALNDLASDGYIVRQQGKGTFVNTNQSTGKKIQVGTKESMSLSNELRQNGFSSTRIVLSLKEVKMTDELKDYFPKSETCYELIRLSSIDNDPYALQICYFPSFYFSSPERFNFADDSIYTYMELQGHKVNTTVS